MVITSSKTTAALAAALLFLAPPLAVQASGQLPPSTLENRNLPSFSACRAFLEAAWRADQNKADPQPIPTDDGTRQTLIYSKGVVAVGNRHLTYEVEEGWQSRRPLLDIKQIRTAYSYERRSYTCNGKHLKGSSISGYALEGYEAMPEN